MPWTPSCCRSASTETPSSTHSSSRAPLSFSAKSTPAPVISFKRACADWVFLNPTAAGRRAASLWRRGKSLSVTLIEMSDDRIRQGPKATELIKNGRKLNSYALSVHSTVLMCSNTLLCEPEEVAARGSSACTARRSAEEAPCRVRVSPSCVVECPCRAFRLRRSGIRQ